MIGRILGAVEQADLPTLSTLYADKDPIIHVMAAMAIERVHFNLAASSSDAAICEDNLIDTRPAVSLLCARFRIGNLRLAGRYEEAHQAVDALLQAYQGKSPVLEKSLAAMRADQTAEAAQPRTSIEQPAHTPVLLPLKQDVVSPTFDATANGHPFELELDTGAGNLILGQDQARALGVKPLNRHGRTRGWLSKNVPVQDGLLDELKIGSIVMRNVPVSIVPRKIALIGVNLVAPLGTIKITQRTIQFGEDNAATASCATPMLVSSGPFGRSLRVIPQLLVNDTLQSVMLDTGSARYLLGTRKALDDVTVLHRTKLAFGDIGGDHRFVNGKTAKVRLTISGQPIEMYFMVLSDSDMAHGMTLGAGALRDMDFLLDFRHQHQCFVLHPHLR
jgi:hypothetical protein